MRLYDKEKIQKILKEALASLDSIDLEEDEIVLEGMDADATDTEFEISSKKAT